MTITIVSAVGPSDHPQPYGAPYPRTIPLDGVATRAAMQITPSLGVGSDSIPFVVEATTDADLTQIGVSVTDAGVTFFSLEYTVFDAAGGYLGGQSGAGGWISPLTLSSTIGSGDTFYVQVVVRTTDAAVGDLTIGLFSSATLDDSATGLYYLVVDFYQAYSVVSTTHTISASFNFNRAALGLIDDDISVVVQDGIDTGTWDAGMTGQLGSFTPWTPYNGFVDYADAGADPLPDPHGPFTVTTVVGAVAVPLVYTDPAPPTAFVGRLHTTVTAVGNGSPWDGTWELVSGDLEPMEFSYTTVTPAPPLTGWHVGRIAW